MQQGQLGRGRPPLYYAVVWATDAPASAALLDRHGAQADRARGRMDPPLLVSLLGTWFTGSSSGGGQVHRTAGGGWADHLAQAVEAVAAQGYVPLLLPDHCVAVQERGGFGWATADSTGPGWHSGPGGEERRDGQAGHHSAGHHHDRNLDPEGVGLDAGFGGIDPIMIRSSTVGPSLTMPSLPSIAESGSGSGSDGDSDQPDWPGDAAAVRVGSCRAVGVGARHRAGRTTNGRGSNANSESQRTTGRDEHNLRNTNREHGNKGTRGHGYGSESESGGETDYDDDEDF